jgi:hypothetical protein
MREQVGELVDSSLGGAGHLCIRCAEAVERSDGLDGCGLLTRDVGASYEIQA